MRLDIFGESQAAKALNVMLSKLWASFLPCCVFFRCSTSTPHSAKALLATLFAFAICAVINSPTSAIPSYPSASDAFEYSVAITNTAIATSNIGDLVVVGSPNDDFGLIQNQGSKYVFKRATNQRYRSQRNYWRQRFDGDSLPLGKCALIRE